MNRAPLSPCCDRSKTPDRRRPVSTILRLPVRLLLTGVITAGWLATGLPELRGGDWQGTPWATYGHDHLAVNRGPGPIYRTLDAVAGGIERLFGLKKRSHACDAFGCDDACDAATPHSMLPPGEFLPMERSPQPMRSTPRPSTGGGLPATPPQPVEPRQQPPSRPLPPPPVQQEEESIFDALSDPFKDDSASFRGGLRPHSQTTAPLLRVPDAPVRQTAAAARRVSERRSK